MSQKDISIVTGASRGIGKAIALRLAEEGHNVMIFGRDAKALDEVKSLIESKGSECLIFKGDVGDTGFVNNSVASVINKYGKIDHLINNAGFGILKEFVNSNLDEFKAQMDTNIFGVYNFTKAVIQGMIDRKSGSIINIASLAGKNAFVGGTMYGATKHALLGFTKSLMLEVRKYNIRVASICPGSVATDFFNDMDNKPVFDKILSPFDVAESVALIIKLPVNALVSDLDIRPTNP